MKNITKQYLALTNKNINNKHIQSAYSMRFFKLFSSVSFSDIAFLLVLSFFSESEESSDDDDEEEEEEEPEEDEVDPEDELDEWDDELDEDEDPDDELDDVDFDVDFCFVLASINNKTNSWNLQNKDNIKLI